MQEPPQPGKSSNCATHPTNEWMDPNCLKLWQFLEGTDSYMDYGYYICLDCRRIWESSMFYQDWEPHWTILTWEQFLAKPERWRDQTGVDHAPKVALQQGFEAFCQWALEQKSLLSLHY